MAYPVGMPTRQVSIGSAWVLESSDPLRLQVTIKSSRSLIWTATGDRFESVVRTVAATTPGTAITVELPTTDSAGWRDATTHSAIDLSLIPGSNTHTYTVGLKLLDAANKEVASYVIGPFPVPSGSGTVDIDLLVTASTVVGELVLVPDTWSAAIAALQEAVDDLEAGGGGGGGGVPDGYITDVKVSGTAAINADKIANGTANKVFTAAKDTKLTGIATGATANDTDANLKARANHTGTQAASTISDFTEAAQDAVASMLAAGTGVTLTYSDATNTLTLAAAGSGSLDAEAVRDAIGIAMVGAGLISVVVNDGADTITISTTATLNSSDATLLNRVNHTGVTPYAGLPVAVPAVLRQASDGTWPSAAGIEATRKVFWDGYPGRTDPPAATGRPAAVAVVDEYTLKV